ncbi:HK97 gp10 family phage protein [Salinibacter ruber]|uniref:HK97 gp10 family phage protein n=1 Tax=Salinibacter ruber TaxID=146919 RepID=UPI002074A98B|nr:HK97 gp10 family phage protein [Salinibacter ruber]
MIDFDGPSTDPSDRFDEFEDEFEEERRRAVQDAQERAKDIVPVDTGALRDSIQVRGTAITTPLDYAHRINFGFVGEDSLGRFYNQEGTYFMTDAALDAFIDSVERLRS